MIEGATEAEVVDAERQLGVAFPADYRSFLMGKNGIEDWFGTVYLVLFNVAGMVEATKVRLEHQPKLFTKLVLIGGDGGGESFGFDFRQTPPSIVMVALVSSVWEDAIYQAASFTDFMEQREEGREFRFADHDA